MLEFRFEQKSFRGVEVVELAGTIDPGRFEELAAALTRHLNDGRTRIVLDCTKVGYIGSNQLQDLLDIARYARVAGGDVKFVGLSANIQQVANLIAMGDPMDCYDDLSDALQGFGLERMSAGQGV